MREKEESCPCALCGEPTTFTGTQRCVRCWELERRVRTQPAVAQRIADALLGRRTNFRDVQAFHDRFGLDRDRPPGPRLLDPPLLRFRLGFLLEELAEFAHASGAVEVAAALYNLALEARTCRVDPPPAQNIVHAFDALLDLNVVSHGTADFMGCPWDAAWDVVMGCNMAKKRAKPDGSDSKRGSPFDVVKPAGWVGPEAALERLLTRTALDSLEDVPEPQHLTQGEDRELADPRWHRTR